MSKYKNIFLIRRLLPLWWEGNRAQLEEYGFTNPTLVWPKKDAANLRMVMISRAFFFLNGISTHLRFAS